MEILTAVGMASSAGLNAYIPLLVAGVLSRYTDVLSLAPGWQWLENPWALGILTVLLVVELLADKVPILDHVNDVLQTVVRPASGGIVFGASGTALTGEATAAATGSGDGTGVWMVAVGAAIALLFHAAKAVTRLMVNGASGGVGAPVVSTVEDVASALMSLLAVLLPVLILVLVVAAVVGLGWLAGWSYGRRRKKERSREEQTG
ncbi:DUF4126 domain-containing protein [Thermobifida halotolerans]|uniref:DUF4126 domain-containing protein n=1 Tax=Thermobifida halotolerans TaxID=483545 RepID=A0AA97M4K2_9ACTN|nr:DUF4126 domain-containing protein [Thermobifida halotolerans]UOE20080.1 DUF4126 domain-containing protein [Thermobifida halotolerans]